MVTYLVVKALAISNEKKKTSFSYLYSWIRYESPVLNSRRVDAAACNKLSKLSSVTPVTVLGITTPWALSRVVLFIHATGVFD